MKKLQSNEKKQENFRRDSPIALKTK